MMMRLKKPNIYIFGASGSGSTTLGRGISSALGLVHVDTDDHYWAPIDPPFSVKNSPEERVRSMRSALGNEGWVLSGACNAWGEELVDKADIIVFTSLATPLRLQRLRSREKVRFGERIEKGGDMFQIHVDFIEWAKGYDDPNFNGRNIGMHERWLERQNKPVCPVNSDCDVESSVQTVIDALAALS
ncbi:MULTISPECIES: adenylate kinase [Pseudophaeobacter]|jgi:adenylate kinase family enzyme|uniref:adenylate kinase n=1 Tax=Pseudophaeobacter TaxID=1541822 RepID=UPI0024308DAA|nr:adenylate kinase [Pseudophaeobacter profundi]